MKVLIAFDTCCAIYCNANLSWGGVRADRRDTSQNFRHWLIFTWSLSSPLNTHPISRNDLQKNLKLFQIIWVSEENSILSTHLCPTRKYHSFSKLAVFGCLNCFNIQNKSNATNEKLYRHLSWIKSFATRVATCFKLFDKASYVKRDISKGVFDEYWLNPIREAPKSSTCVGEQDALLFSRYTSYYDSSSNATYQARHQNDSVAPLV